MLTQEDDGRAMNEQAIELIARRVIDALRDDLEAIASELSAPTPENEQLTVEQVAHHLGVTRSTVYAHWREWGGYKLGTGPKARIRFDRAALPVTKPTREPQSSSTLEPTRKPARRKRRRRDLLVAAPRLAQPVDQLG